MQFTLDSRLAHDTDFLLDEEVCQVRVMKNALFPWLVLVPKLAGLEELVDVPEPLRSRIRLEIDHATKVLREITSAEKMNVAYLGNVVRQLHIHIVARFEEDAAWPSPVWGKGSVAYDDEALAHFKERLIKAYKGE